MQKKLIRFDWAIKKLLRNKANFVVLEGFLSELLKIDVQIESILESEGNQTFENDKFNRVDILVKTQRGELMLVEIQNDPEDDYFQRMIYGISKLITEYIQIGEPYGVIKKTFSINIVYFGLGQGKDYIYVYKGCFEGMHEKHVLKPTETQKHKYLLDQVADIFPKYYILKVNDFDDIAKDTLDEWIYFLKNSEIKDEFKAKGLKQAKEILEVDKLPEDDRKGYQRFMENRMLENSVIETVVMNTMKATAKKLIERGYPLEEIIEITNLSKEEIKQI